MIGKAAPFAAQADLEMRAEEDQLRRSHACISAGLRRLRQQEDLIRHLKAAARPAGEAERLGALMRDNLAQWERHRALIEQRLAYLRGRVGLAPPAAPPTPPPSAPCGSGVSD